LSYFAKAVNLSSTSKFYISVDGVGFAKWNQDGTLSSVSGGTASNGQNMGNGWFRFTYVVTSGVVANYGLSDNSSTSTALFWGLQLEAGSYPTSYIPTTSAAVTRNADVISKTGISSLIGQTEGTMFIEFDFISTSTAAVKMLISGTQSVALFSIGTSIYASAAGVALFNFVQGTNGRLKVALAYKSGSSAIYVNGVQKAVSSAALTLTSISNLFLNQNAGGGEKEILPTYQALLFTTRLSNAQLATLTTI
jgi:hypothetical protein